MYKLDAKKHSVTSVAVKSVRHSLAVGLRQSVVLAVSNVVETMH